ncbi:unnamed protein product [Rotaria sordida]|uniref:Uncharacterized protein n=1 Tax=Rotaria sordida TaxID=392033 RepID=A0A818ZC44_9BILA|nr:unnamed protein product [Rotaria sordida]CAF1328344.1 unnamed protein product [Rotaria sordida]CAF1340583.1 unnamed protein product [Rotaria sordida]CAF1408791.1 unnamed protein product [Rotaria sordida]CAF1596393.1 unnamed protein product [Rotaria sordida]
MSESVQSQLIAFNDDHISIYPWQDCTIENLSLTTEPAFITISPSQFRLIFSSHSTAVKFAYSILQFVLKKIPSRRLIVLIADQIQKYSIAVFEHKNDKRAHETAITQGRKIRQIFDDACQQLSSTESQMIEIIQWNDILRSSNYDSRVELYRHFINNVDSQSSQLIDKVR